MQHEFRFLSSARKSLFNLRDIDPEINNRRNKVNVIWQTEFTNTSGFRRSVVKASVFCDVTRYMFVVAYRIFRTVLKLLNP